MIMISFAIYMAIFAIVWFVEKWPYLIMGFLIGAVDTVAMQPSEGDDGIDYCSRALVDAIKSLF